jgi:hypothetical protein
MGTGAPDRRFLQSEKHGVIIDKCPELAIPTMPLKLGLAAGNPERSLGLIC